MIQNERIKALNDLPPGTGKYVLYWMQQSGRAHYNHALEFALDRAHSLDLPLLVVFVLTDEYPEANLRHYRFLLEGLEDTRSRLARRSIQLVVLRGQPVPCVSAAALGAALVVCDRGYVRVQRRWRAEIARRLDCPCMQVESDVVVPVERAYPKEAYSAGILRPKLHGVLEEFLVGLPETPTTHSSLDIDIGVLGFEEHSSKCEIVSSNSGRMGLEGPPLAGPEGVEAELDIDRSVGPVGWIRGGTTAALTRLEEFLATKIDRFHERRNDPSVDYLSHLSPYLHFGHISPLYVVLQVMESSGGGLGSTKSSENSPGHTSPAPPQAPGEGAAAFIEELVIRRELAMNFVYYNHEYDSYSCLPEWAQKTLSSHELDRRDYLYSLPQLEEADTHDPYWNAAQRELTGNGKMHGYMRMYWGKKILEWSPQPQVAFERALYLNNKYSLDGRDPNSFAGVAWCFGKHDRPWSERRVFGKTRYMNANGLKRKFDIEGYVQKLS